MVKKYIKVTVALTLALCIGLMPGCTRNSESTASSTSTEQTTEESEKGDSVSSVEFDDEDYYTDWSDDNPTYITLEDNKILVDGEGASENANKITITSPGTYVISGTLEDGQIVVNCLEKETVRLVLNGVNINCDTSAPIYIEAASKAVISLEEGTENYLSDGEAYEFADAQTDEPDSTLFSKDDLTINGLGTLNITGNYKNAITCKDSLKIMEGTYKIKANNNGIKGKDMVAIKDGVFQVESGNDGIKATNSTDTAKGFIYIENGQYNITSIGDAFQAETNIIILDGTYDLYTGGGSANASIKTENQTMNWGQWQKNETNQDTTSENSKEVVTTEDEDAVIDSAKGIKATSDISILGGKFNIDSSDDSIHSNGNISISNGEFNISSGDDGIHGDKTLDILDGKIEISKSYEGIEANAINISGGNISIVASDDGINVAGGNDLSSLNGRSGQNSFFDSDDSCILNISGGYIYVDADGDGLDSNGSITMSGGTAIVNGPTNDGNGALDYNSTFDMTGGILVAAGSSGMAQTVSDSSKEYCIALSTGSQQAGTLVSIVDSEGKDVITFSPSKTFSSVVICSPEFENGKTYSAYVGGSSSAKNTNGFYETGAYTTGTLLYEFTISDIITNVSSNGTTNGSSQGTMGGGGGGRGDRTDMIMPSQTAPDGETMPDGVAPDGVAPDGVTMPDGVAPNGEALPDGATSTN